MPAPATVDELLELVVKSGVADDTRLKAYAQKLAEDNSVPADPSKMAGQLVRDGHLTYFQAEQLLQGKWKRFTIGKYKVLERLGAGGMGQVFLCEHKFMRRRVAVKVLPTAKAEDPASLDRFYREARAVAAVDHPNLVRAYDIDQDDNLHFIVMEYVDGTNLQDLVKKIGPLEVNRACHYIYGSAVGLQHAHEVGLVHRDVKPGNILVDRTGVVKILDLGLARFFHDEADDLTKKYDENVLGTADYLAPEQALESHSVDIRADIYSLGATFYFLLTGSAPFPEGSVAQKLIWHQTRVPKSIAAIRPEVPADIVAIVEKMMAKDAAQRYQTPGEVMTALAQRVSTPIPPPHERELPQLSPAAAGAGGQGLRPSLTSMTHIDRLNLPSPTMAPTAPPTQASTWPGASSGTAPAASPALVMPPTIVDSNNVSPGGVWEGLASDTQNLESSDTDRPAIVSPSSHSSRIHKGSSGKGQRKRVVPVWVWVGGSLVLAIAAVVVLFNIRGSKPTPANPGDPHGPGSTTQPPRTPITIYVSKQGGENTFPTLQRALALARPGDRIEIREKVVDERSNQLPLRIGGQNHKDLVITSSLAGNEAASIEFAVDPTATPSALLELVNADGVTLKNISIDGKSKFGAGILVTGNCPGLLIEDVKIRNTTAAGIQLEDAAGTPERPIVLDRLDLKLESKDKQYGLAMLASPDRAVKHVIARNGRYEGISSKRKDSATGKDVYTSPSGGAIRINGPCEDVLISQNRIHNGGRGLSVGELAEKGSLSLKVENNTFSAMKAGVVFDSAGDPKAEYHVVLRRNLFSKVDSLAKHSGQMGTIPGFLAEKGNVIDDTQNSNKEGNLKIEPIKVDNVHLQKPSPGSGTTPGNTPDAQFLWYSGSGKLGKGIELDGEKVMVGAYQKVPTP